MVTVHVLSFWICTFGSCHVMSCVICHGSQVSWGHRVTEHVPYIMRHHETPQDIMSCIVCHGSQVSWGHRVTEHVPYIMRHHETPQDIMSCVVCHGSQVSWGHMAHRSHCAIMRHHEMLRDNMQTKRWSICRRMRYRETHEANEATVFYKRLASCLAMKWDHSYSSTKSWLRCRLTFSLPLRSAIQCITGAYSSNGHVVMLPPLIDLAISELCCIWTIWLPDPWLFHCSLHLYYYKLYIKIQM